MRFHSAWRLFYDRLACLYDVVSGCVSRGNWKAWGRSAIDYLPHQRVLELAHGPGHLLIALKTAGYRPVGIDRSPSMGSQASRRLRRAGLRVPLVRCRAEALPFRSGSFDNAVATFPTDYILDPGTIREVARVTSDRARLVIVAGAQRTGPEPDPHFLGWLAGLTGQGGSAENGQETIFSQAGMRARVECRPVGAGAVMLIIAEKQPTPVPATAQFEPERRPLAPRAPSRADGWVPAPAGHSG